MKRVILHIGQPKTGTSTLQAYFSGRPAGSAGPLYPAAGRNGAGAHHALACALLEEARRPRWVAPTDLRAFPVELAAEMERAQADTALLSSEIFSSLRGLDALAGLLAGFEVTVVVALRRQDLFLDAVVQHKLKVLELAEPVDDWLQSRGADGRLDYDAMLARWETTFGRDRIRLLPFEPATWATGLVQHLHALCGLPLPAGFGEPAPVNERVCRDGVAAMQWLHHVAGVEARRVLRLRPALEQYTACHDEPREWRHRIAPAARRALLAQCSQGNARLGARYFGDGPGARPLFTDLAIDGAYAPYPGLSGQRAESLVAWLREQGPDPELAGLLQRTLAA